MGMVSLANPEVSSSRAVQSAASFLDSSLVLDTPTNADPNDVAASPELEAFIEDKSSLQQSINSYFELIDVWMPFIPRRELEKKASLHQINRNGPDTLLLACVKLLADDVRDTNNARPKEYLAVKSTALAMEIAGVLTLTQLQAVSLILFYEFAHGLYPSAYSTLGTCHQYLLALGISNQDPCWSQALDWMETEKRRRLWWVVFVMDRYVYAHG